jgi:hypothetical protein
MFAPLHVAAQISLRNVTGPAPTSTVLFVGPAHARVNKHDARKQKSVMRNGFPFGKWVFCTENARDEQFPWPLRAT